MERKGTAISIITESTWLLFIIPIILIFLGKITLHDIRDDNWFGLRKRKHKGHEETERREEE